MPHLVTMPNIPARLPRTKHWCFTLNNYTPAEENFIRDVAARDASVSYIVFGHEIAPTTNTPHLQGFISFDVRRGFTYVRDRLGPRVHIEAARGTPYEAAEYCKKGEDIYEHGIAPRSAGNANNRGVERQFDQYREWVEGFYAANGRGPFEREIAREHPSLFCRYNRALLNLTGHLVPTPRIEEGELRDWQIDLNNELHDEGNDRTVKFVVDPAGGSGKSYFQRWFLTNNPDVSQILSIGKRDDIAHAIDVSKTIFLFNVPRGGMEFMQYTVLEQIKDRVVFSPKYNSATKILLPNTKVVVFCNEAPDYTKMTEDRYDVLNL